MTSDPVPAITEAQAIGETADIFADVRATLRVDVVNLIWRHLATMPGALPWIWSAVRPLYLDHADGHAAAVRATLPLPRAENFSLDTLTAAGLGPADLGAIDSVLDSYHHTNALALVVLSGLLSYYDPTPQETVPPARSPPPPMAAPLPALLTMEAMRPDVARLIRELNGFGEDAEPGVIASMYRHLAHWPVYLSLVRTLLAPLEQRGELRALVRATRALGRAHGHALAPLLTPGEPPEAAARALAACRRFVEHPIARMVGICAIMRAATPPVRTSDNLQKP